MKIALAGQSWGSANGPGVFARRLAHGLAERGHESVALVPTTCFGLRWSTDGPVVLAQIPAVRVAPSHPEIRLTPAPFRGVLRVLQQFQPDVVHIQDHYLLSRAALDAACRMQLPVLATNHFLPANILPHVPFSRRLKKIARFAERFLWRTLVSVLERTFVVTTPTETAAAILRPHLCRVPVRVVSCGVDLDRFNAPTVLERSAARRRWQIKPEEIVFTYVGRLDLEKRVDLLIEALAQVAQPNLRLLVAGRGHQLSALRALAARRRVSPRVTFLGFVEDRNLLSLLHASDFFAMPSAAELQSIATLEAMATGLPVLAAGACALPELVASGVNGELFEPGVTESAAEKIRLLTRRLDARPFMSQASRQRAAAHSIRATTTEYESIYRELGSSLPASGQMAAGISSRSAHR